MTSKELYPAFFPRLLSLSKKENMQKEITRKSLHSSLRNKSKEIQDKFLEVANACICKGMNTTSSISTANKAMEISY